MPFDYAPPVRLLVRVAQALGIPTFTLNDGYKADDVQLEERRSRNSGDGRDNLAEQRRPVRRRRTPPHQAQAGRLPAGGVAEEAGANDGAVAEIEIVGGDEEVTVAQHADVNLRTGDRRPEALLDGGQRVLGVRATPEAAMNLELHRAARRRLEDRVGVRARTTAGVRTVLPRSLRAQSNPQG